MKILPFFKHVEWEPDAAELRRFAVAMLVGFGVLGCIAALKAHHLSTSSYVLWTVGMVLAVAALVPVLGRAAYLAVYLPSSLVGYIVSHVLLTLVFFVLFTPLAFLLRLLGMDLLQTRPGAKPAWAVRTDTPEKSRYYRQF